METQEDAISDDDTAIATVEEMRQQLETRIEARCNDQEELIASLQTLVPDLVSSLNLSLQVISAFNHRSFTPLSYPTDTNPVPSTARPLKMPPENHCTNHRSADSKPAHPKPNQAKPSSEAAASNRRTDCEKFAIDDSGSPLSVVRSMVAVCLLERVPFSPIDSSTVLRKLENDQKVTAAEKAALREVGGESGTILAVEMALRSMAEENGGVELEEFVVSGKSRVMVMNIDRTRLVKELPESSQHPQQLESSLIDANQPQVSGNIGAGAREDVNGAIFGMAAPIPRPLLPEIWGLGPGDPHLSGMPPIFPGQGPRGSTRGMGMLGMPRGMGIPPPHRPPFGPNPVMGGSNAASAKQKTEEDVMKDLEALLNKKSFREMQKSKTGEELMDLIHRPTARETAVAAKFKTKGGSQLKEYCSALTKEDCRQKSGSYLACEKVHFRRIIAPHTDINLGDCSFLDTCRHMKTCKYVHYELDPTPDVSPMIMGASALPPQRPLKPQRAEYCSEVELGEAQWINCDIRKFRMDILGQFGVIMADPPWDIHMELPYGTMADDEMRTLNVPALQTDGLIFLWVTGRAMELGRECLELWGYKRVEELIWVKTNQLQRIIRTGRTGHWLNHSKEHCLVGIKGNPEVNRNIDTDVIVAEVRETSRKPDEMYPMLERISPRTRKLELFARMHNTHAGWLSLGNQLNGVRLVDEGLRARFRAAYPDIEIQPPSPPRSFAIEVDANATQMRAPFAGEFKQVPPQFAQLPPPSQGGYASEEKPMGQDVEMMN
ncbi:hypothetical protein Nepgr_030676 [Nepenthes gracilis]|uniref:N6-adenosine-methyltransferase MT-A70-like n=1 Tax=Nepenthes gracilis TaxID=150966 RepID=A0AAD3TF82_NEPGR|nr:hypothetical protein Nepgr_030676 [Nepenthes gracilis]